MKISDVYAMPDLPGYRGIHELCKDSNSPLFELADIYWNLEDEDLNGPVKVKHHIDINFDHRRYMVLASVWFEDKPFMVFARAGREGDDDVAAWTTDWGLRGAAVGHLMQIATLRRGPAAQPKAASLDMELPEHYGRSFDYWHSQFAKKGQR